MLRQISLASLGLVVGSILTITGFIAYATGNATLNLAGFFYGIPVLLGGLALKAAELKPVAFTQPTTPEVLALREKQQTPTQKQIRQDVTRYRYGQEVHLDDSLKRLGLGTVNEDFPKLTGLQEKAIDGAYSLIMEFDSSFVSLETWESKQEKIEKFFGPGIKAIISQPTENKIDLTLTAVVSG
jgi:hypothetical protein